MFPLQLYNTENTAQLKVLCISQIYLKEDYTKLASFPGLPIDCPVLDLLTVSIDITRVMKWTRPSPPF